MIFSSPTQLPLRPSVIFMQELASDGLSFTADSEPGVVLTTDRLSEHLIVEGPWLMYRRGRYYLFYSSSWVQLASYHVGVAVSESVGGPYTKTEVPVIQTAEVREGGFAGPGHGSVVEDREGSWWFVYAVWRAGLLNTWPPGRIMMLDKITWSVTQSQL